MHHDDHISARGQSLAIASLLIAPIAVVTIVYKRLQAKAASDFDRTIGTVVVDKNPYIDQSGNSRTVASNVFSAL
jgi:hypothetical protein